MIHSVMIVDDCILLTRAISRYLVKSGYTVTTVTSASGAMRALLAGNLPDFALVDINLGTRINGIHLGSQFKALGVPLMYMTGMLDARLRIQAEETGPVAIAMKGNLSVGDIVRAIQTVSHGSPTHPLVGPRSVRIENRGIGKSQ